MKPSPNAKQAGFSLLELLVAMSITVVLVGLISAIAVSASQWSINIHKDTTIRYDGKSALDYIGADFSTLAKTEFGRTSLTIVPEEIVGQNGNQVSSAWLLLLNRPASTTQSGSANGVSYRVAYTDPMTPNGNLKRFSLYRSVVKPQPSSAATSGSSIKPNDFLAANDLETDYWETYWPIYSSENAGRTLLDDFLVDNVVKFEVLANYTFRTDQGLQKGQSLIFEDSVSWTPQGFANHSDIPIPNTPTSITVSLTTLSEVGAQQLEDQTPATWKSFLLKEGLTVSRTFPITTAR